MHAPQSPVHFTANLALSTRREFARTVGAKGGVPARIAFVGNRAALALEAHVAAESHAASRGTTSTFPLFLLMRFLRVAAATAAHGGSGGGGVVKSCLGIF